jgi:cytidylate kinase
MPICLRLVRLHPILRSESRILKRINIAIDGHSSCGKGTLAKQLAAELGYKFIDSGAMYRAVTLHMLRAGIPTHNVTAVATALPEISLDFMINQETGRSDVWLNGENVEKEIRSMTVAESVSQVAKISEVRRFLVALQQKMGADKGVVMDGRDIGTVVFPDAELKIFMTATPEVRAHRRFNELLENGTKTTYDEVLANLKQRDQIDSSRSDSPLTMTEDYKLLDNSNLNREDQFRLAMSWVTAILGSVI